MAGSNFFALLDDIASILDDIALLTKVAAKKTTGVLGDDLALNAQQVSGVRADRELPVVWAVAKGSAVNKLILIPLALLISWLAPWLVTPLLVVGGAFLCFEGCEKIFHSFAKDHDAHEPVQRLAERERTPAELVELEKGKIKGAVKTDFILSAEIIVITLGTVKDADISKQIVVLIITGLLMTVGVYGLVAAIVKIDDFGQLLLSHSHGPTTMRARVGRLILGAAPWLMRTLSVVGTVAMFLVGGGILVHGLPALHHAVEGATQSTILRALIEAAIGFALGSVIVGILVAFKKIRSR